MQRSQLCAVIRLQRASRLLVFYDIVGRLERLPCWRCDIGHRPALLPDKLHAGSSGARSIIACMALPINGHGMLHADICSLGYLLTDKLSSCCLCDILLAALLHGDCRAFSAAPLEQC